MFYNLDATFLPQGEQEILTGILRVEGGFQPGPKLNPLHLFSIFLLLDYPKLPSPPGPSRRR
jgi:hypothetical protein